MKYYDLKIISPGIFQVMFDCWKQYTHFMNNRTLFCVSSVINNDSMLKALVPNWNMFFFFYLNIVMFPIIQWTFFSIKCCNQQVVFDFTTPLGEYLCKATNDLGSSNRTIRLRKAGIYLEIFKKFCLILYLPFWTSILFHPVLNSLRQVFVQEKENEKLAPSLKFAR